MTSDLPMGRWREMSQAEVDILSEEVGLKPVALPSMKAKTKEKIDRMQRKVAKPLGRGERRSRVLRPAHEADMPVADKPRAARDDKSERKPRGSDKPRGTPVAERPGIPARAASATKAAGAHRVRRGSRPEKVSGPASGASAASVPERSAAQRSE